MLVRLELQEAGAVLGAGVPVLCVSLEGWQVLTDRPAEVDRLFAGGWYLYVDREEYERATGENVSGEVIGSATGLDVLFSWIEEAETREERKGRVAYGTAWVKGQVRLGVLAAETAQKVLDFLQSFGENTAI